MFNINLPSKISKSIILINHLAYQTGLTHWGRDKMDAISQTIFWILNENVWIPIKISLKFVP